MSKGKTLTDLLRVSFASHPYYSLLRGLTKLLKFRFRFDSTTEAGYGETSFNDIPVVRELRKLHRDANKLQRVAPHSSSLEKKWLSWPEYLQVVQSLQAELETLLKEYDGDDPLPDQESYTWAQRKIAAAFQRYLVLAIFSNVPDRQRTIRELEIGRTFVRSDDSVWTIRHAPDDYKTGKTYGERPPLQLAPSLTGLLDDFVRRWRVCLKPTSGHNKLFCQVRTGNPFTADSVYQTVGRACFAATGKRTNPHLLRDMIVTHIREHSEASEQQLEALALFMGHSLAVQRSSYDRRTLKTKVAPAVHLLQSVNAGANLGDVRK